MSVKILASAVLAIAAGAAGQVMAQSAAESAPAAGARVVERDAGLYDFEYSYPAKAAAIPALREYLDDRIVKVEARLRREARESWKFQKEFAEKELAEASADEMAEARDAIAKIDMYQPPYRAHYLAVGWEVEADLSRWLSLSATVETYSGGAHGNRGFDTLVWDKQASKVRKPVDLFVSAAALRGAIRPTFCDRLDTEREERRGEPVERGGDDSFDACIDPLESTLALASKGGTAFDTIAVLVGPYEAGPYVEGTYEIEIPVSPAIMATVRPEFRAGFSAGL